MESHLFLDDFFVLYTYALQKVDLHFVVWNFKSIVIVIVNVQNEFMIAFEVAESDCVDGRKRNFPPDCKFVLEGN